MADREPIVMPEQHITWIVGILLYGLYAYGLYFVPTDDRDWAILLTGLFPYIAARVIAYYIHERMVRVAGQELTRLR